MASSGGYQGVGLRRFRARGLEKHQLWFSFGVFSLKATRIAQYDRANLLQHPHRTDIASPQVQDHNLFRVNTQGHDSRLRKLGLCQGRSWKQEADRYQMHQTQTNFHLTSLSELVFAVLGLIPVSRR